MSQEYRDGGFDLVEPLEGPRPMLRAGALKPWRGVPAMVLSAQSPTPETTPGCARKPQHRGRREALGESAGTTAVGLCSVSLQT